MDRHTIFISDLHLSDTTIKTTNLFLKFMEETALNADALYILGDLFRFWIGDDNCSIFNQKIKTALKQASSKIPIYLMPGNRDFLLEKTFAKETGCSLIPDPYAIDLYGRKTVLTHGDLLCSKDISYGIFRNIIRFPYGIKIFLKLPLAIRLWFANNTQKYSAKTKIKKSKDILAAQPKPSKNLLNKFNASQIIHGHTHIAEVEELVLDNKLSQRISLGEWNEQGSVLIYHDNHNFEFKALS